MHTQRMNTADYQHMAQALQLARRGLYTTSPNPRVGCVIVRDEKVIGSGWHERAGGPHAEVLALREASAAARGATLYVTLEPCHHHGRTPPCDQAVIAAGVERVVVAMSDPDPRTSGAGIDALRAAGIAVDVGVMESEARELNIGFISRLQRGRPWTRMKIAASLDGRTALLNGDSQWITGAPARRDGHHWRARACAVLTGIGTVRADDPQMTVREIETTRQPLRIVVDSKLEISPQAKILQGGAALIVCAVDDQNKKARLLSIGAEVLTLPDTQGKVDLQALLMELGRRGINELHIEAGAKLNGALIAANCVDELLMYFAPVLLGDAARGIADLPQIQSLRDKRKLKITETRTIGDDIRILARMETS